jgi:hypothetical protein
MRLKAKTRLALAAGLLLAGCHHGTSAPEPSRQVDNRTRYTCCNLHYEGDETNDANYWTGKTLPAGTAVRIEKLTEESVTFSAGGERLTLKHEYGTKQERFSQYLDKILVLSDPRPRIGAYPPAVRRAIDNSKVERGMTREQVILALGYPPTHRTPSLREREWTYWYNRWVTYKVVFGDAGKVADVVGRPAPTAEMPIANADASPPSAASQTKSSKHSKSKKKK